ncbi:hypothetical protein KBC59_00125 [Patescibacteria group bacterium]|nr:hypothetical protein [Patescibacteria group bacterium]
MPMPVETAPKRNVEKQPKKEKESPRVAMCSSFEKSAKKVASLGIFLASTNGIAGCVGSKEPHVPDFWGADEVGEGPVASDIPLTFQQMTEEVKAKLPRVIKKEHIGGKEYLDWSGASREVWDQGRHQSRDEGKRREVRERKQELPNLAGFEKFEIRPELVKEYLKTMPASWVHPASVPEVVLDPRFVPIHYPGAIHGESAAAHAIISHESAKIRILDEGFLSENPGVRAGATFDTFRRVLLHEFAHTQSWKTSPKLTPAMSTELLYRTLKAVESDQRPKTCGFNYPDKIQKEETLLRMTEHYAVLMENALSYATSAESWEDWRKSFSAYLQVECEAGNDQAEWNARLVQRFFSWTEPTFKPWIANRERGEVIADILHAQADKAWRKEISASLNPAMRALFERALEEGTVSVLHDLLSSEEAEDNSLGRYTLEQVEKRVFSYPLNGHERMAILELQSLLVPFITFQKRRGHGNYPQDFSPRHVVIDARLGGLDSARKERFLDDLHAYAEEILFHPPLVNRDELESK